MNNKEILLRKRSSLRPHPNAQAVQTVETKAPLRSSVNPLKLLVLMAIGAFVGVSIMCNGGISIGSLSKAMLNLELNSFIDNLLRGRSAVALGWGALMGACCSAALYLLANSSSNQARPKPVGRHDRARSSRDMHSH